MNIISSLKMDESNSSQTSLLISKCTNAGEKTFYSSNTTIQEKRSLCQEQSGCMNKVCNAKEIFVHSVSVKESIEAVLHDLPYLNNSSIVLKSNFEEIQSNLLKTFSSSFEALENNQNGFKDIKDSVFAAFYTIGIASVDMFNNLTKNWIDSSFNFLENFGDMIKVICFLLNPENVGFLKWSQQKINEKWLESKVKVMMMFLSSLKDVLKQNNRRAASKKDEAGHYEEFVHSCLTILGKNKKKHKVDLQNKDKSKEEYDGTIYDRARDPPGQRSVYIPPGDVAKESYRLSTFFKFPQGAPVNPSMLAKVGFYFTGYKDRVKCFSCGLCVENWVVGDEVSSPSWHRPTCMMMLNQDCGNVPLGGLFSHFARAIPNSSSRLTTESGASKAASRNLPSSSYQSPAHSRVPAGQLLTQTSGIGFASSNAMRQTARPVNSSQNPNQNYQRVELATISSAYHEQLINSLDLRKEEDRLKSFDNWPTQTRTVQPGDLARSGFFYLGNVDRVQCFSCGGVLRNWRHGDSVDEEHRRHFSNCRMINRTDNRNVPLPTQNPTPVAFPSRPVVFQEPSNPSEAELRELADMFPCHNPENPHMRSEESRFETFDQRWPRSRVNATPRQIARAGFFFLGERDRVKCWYCNGGLQNWDPEDEPWSEHAKWFPSCEFLIRHKGPDFIRRMMDLFPNLQRPILRNSYDVPPSLRSNVLRSGRRPPSPPPPIIDPRVELQRQKEALKKAMESDNAKAAIEMGFSRRMVKKVIKKKITEGNGAHNSLSELIDILTSEEISDSSDEETNAMNIETPAKATGETGTEISGASNRTPASTSVTETGDTSSFNAPMETEFSLPEDISPSMQARIRELQEERKCKICLDRDADVVFIPCGHLCSCMTCAASIRKCPICRLKIEKTMRTYMA